MKAHVYTITFPDGSIYVGSTIQLVKRRVSGHITALRHQRRPVKSLVAPFVEFGWAKVDGCQTFKDAIINSIDVEINTPQELRQHEQRVMNTVSRDKLLNIRRTDDRNTRPHNFTIKPVSCDVWANLLYSETNEQTKAA